MSNNNYGSLILTVGTLAGLTSLLNIFVDIPLMLNALVLALVLYAFVHVIRRTK